MVEHAIDGSRPYDPEALAPKPEAGVEPFAAIDLRIGRIVEVEEFPEARKPAWKLTVDFGPRLGRLRTSAQITNYDRDELLGRTVVGAVNLGHKRIAGFTSEFLVLGGLRPDGTVQLLAPDADLAPGSVVS